MKKPKTIRLDTLHPDPRNPRKIKAVCKTCGSEFVPRKFERGRNPQVFCSSVCYGDSLKTPVPKRICKWCGDEYQSRRRGSFCSRTCFGEAHKGRVVSKESREKMSKSHIGKKHPYESGEHHWNWQGGKSTESVRERAHSQYSRWRAAVFARDGFKCVRCGAGGELNAHHVIPFSEAKEKRLDISNGITLCLLCHGKEHNKRFSKHALNRCPVCGKRIKVGAKICLVCRMKQTKDRWAENWVCVECGKQRTGKIILPRTPCRCRSCAAKKRCETIKPFKAIT